MRTFEYNDTRDALKTPSDPASGRIIWFRAGLFCQNLVVIFNNFVNVGLIKQNSINAQILIFIIENSSSFFNNF